MNQQDRRQRAYERPNRRILAIWLVLCAIFAAVGLQRILQGQFPDPDDALRLVQVRDLLAGQSWFDLHQYRIDPPGGTLMHWSRLVDLPIALVILLLTPLIGAAAAETTALIAVPLLTLGAILLCIGRLAWRLFDANVAGFACLSLGLLAPFVFQLQPMRIDHHGWQIFSVALALWAIAGRSAIKRGALAGFAMAFGLTISVELLPMAAAFGGVLALRWFRDWHQRWWLVAYMQALALGLVALFFATRGISDLAQHCDVVSPAHLGFFVIAAIGTGTIAAVPNIPRVMLIGLFALAGAAGLAFFALSAPSCLAAPFSDLDPLVRKFWYVNVTEGRPLWEQDLALALPSLLQLFVAMLVAIFLVQNSRDWLKNWWIDYALLLAASIVPALFVWRSAGFAAVIAAIPVGWFATRLLQRFRAAGDLKAKIILLGILILLLLPSAPVNLVRMALPAPQTQIAAKAEESQCRIREQAARLNGLEAGTVFAPFDIGPAILVESHHAVVATSHHRADMAMRDVIAAFTAPEAEARKLVAAHGSDYVAMCTDLAEPRLFKAAAPGGFAARLIDGDAPAWLEPVAIDGSQEFKVWRVRE